MLLTLPQGSQMQFGEKFLPRFLYMARKEKHQPVFSNSETLKKERHSS